MSERNSFFLNYFWIFSVGGKMQVAGDTVGVSCSISYQLQEKLNTLDKLGYNTLLVVD